MAKSFYLPPSMRLIGIRRQAKPMSTVGAAGRIYLKIFPFILYAHVVLSNERKTIHMNEFSEPRQPAEGRSSTGGGSSSLAGIAVWLLSAGTAGLGYQWQWYRVPRFLFTTEGGGWTAGPLLQGLLVTLRISPCRSSACSSSA